MIVCANLFFYAMDATSRHHPTARTWLADALNGVERVGLPWVSLMAFQRAPVDQPDTGAGPRQNERVTGAA